MGLLRNLPFPAAPVGFRRSKSPKCAFSGETAATSAPAGPIRQIPDTLLPCHCKCNHAECGACTVMADGATVYSCSTLTHRVRDKEITTVEGIASADGTLHSPRQSAGSKGVERIEETAVAPCGRPSVRNADSVRPAKWWRRSPCNEPQLEPYGGRSQAGNVRKPMPLRRVRPLLATAC